MRSFSTSGAYFPDSTFVFKHALTREVVYDTLLEKKKKGLHLDIGRAIEEVHQDNLEEMYGPLAEHFEGGGDYEKAAQYFGLAETKARSASVYIDAIALSKKGVACLEKLPQTHEIQKQVIDARVVLAYNYLSSNHFAEAREAVAPIINLVQELDYRKRLPAIYNIMASYLLMVEERYNDDEMHHYIRDARRLALEEKDYRSLWYTHYYEGIAKTFNCEFAEGEASFLRLMEMAEASGDLTDAWNSQAQYIGLCLCFLGKDQPGPEVRSRGPRTCPPGRRHTREEHGIQCLRLSLMQEGPVFGGGRKLYADV